MRRQGSYELITKKKERKQVKEKTFEKNES